MGKIEWKTDEEIAEEKNRPSKTKENELAVLELAGMFSMVIPQMRTTLSTQTMSAFETSNDGGANMIALLYATNIIEGYLTFKDVGHFWVEDVKNILISEGREDLIHA